VIIDLALRTAPIWKLKIEIDQFERAASAH